MPTHGPTGDPHNIGGFSSVSNPNIWNTDFLEENPAFAFGAYRPQRGKNFAGAPKSFFDYYQERQAPLEREFVAEQGSLARSGQPPTGTNVDFLSNYPWMANYLKLSPGQRGQSFAPRLKWLIPR
jgi:hypothetical protein